MTTLLSYALTTDPFPLQASPSAGPAAVAKLTVVAANPNADPDKNPVTLQGVSITVMVGPDANDLTDAASLGAVAPAGWTLNTKPGAGTVEFVFTPQAGQGVVGKRGLAFIFNSISVNEQPGLTTVTVKEGTPGNPTAQLAVTKFPSGWGTVSLWADPPEVASGGSTTLNWSGPAGASDDPATYTIEYFDFATGQVVNAPAQGEPAFANQGQYPAQGGLTPAQTTTYTLKVSDIIAKVPYAAQQQATVTVEIPPPTLTLTAAPTVVEAYDPQPVQLQWTTTHASYLSIDGVGVFTGQQVASGSTTDAPPLQRQEQPKVYTAAAYGLPGYAGPPAPATATVTFNWVGTVESDWLNYFGPDGTVLWSLKLNSGRHVLDLFSKHTSSTFGIVTDVFAQLAPGVQAADVGTGGASTPPSKVTGADFGDSLPKAVLLNHVTDPRVPSSGQDPFNPENVNQTWALMFPDGLIVALWFSGVSSQGFPQSYQLTFGLMATPGSRTT